MATMEIIKINPQKLEKKKLNEVINLLKKDGVIIFPTDTVYIPLANAESKKAVRKVFLIKKRSPENSIPVFVKDIKTAKKIVIIDKKQEKILRTSWPGRVTMILKRRKGKVKIYGVGKKTIALRIPKFKPINYLLKKFNKLLVGTSANISGRSPSGKISEVLRQFEGKKYQPDLAVDAGILRYGKPSKIIDLTVWPSKTLRS